jgi:SAM-dependent methyltransferase
MASLEHMPYPWKGFSEIVRVVKPGGRIIILVPHLSRYHEEPFDFFRFTKYGLKALGDLHGLAILETKPVGGLGAFLGHQISTILLGLVWNVPVLKWIIFWFNYAFCVRLANILDSMLNTKNLFPMDVLMVFAKSAATEAASPDGAVSAGKSTIRIEQGGL